MLTLHHLNNSKESVTDGNLRVEEHAILHVNPFLLYSYSQPFSNGTELFYSQFSDLQLYSNYSHVDLALLFKQPINADPGLF